MQGNIDGSLKQSPLLAAIHAVYTKLYRFFHSISLIASSRLSYIDGAQEATSESKKFKMNLEKTSNWKAIY
ncbi:MAG: hypothetical protein EZS28_003799 [Streblomastix strix]|uniref:Uncharacterized protein n=1 Tax=Streblomastix strix TaxID=222440 RepID=A0A5J4X1R0_9EUKA|nr:MAG: hypothetical protein EZS28_003799 [Streblomastix strix]